MTDSRRPKMTSVLLATPPLLMPNGPYPATAYLAGFLRTRGIAAHQVDLSILLVTRLLSRAFLPRLRRAAEGYAATRHGALHPTVAFFLEAYEDYERAIDPVMAFLQGKDPSLAHRIGSRAFCPEGPSFVTLQVYGDLLTRGFGPLAFQDRAKLLAVLFLMDLVNVITATVDEDFTVWRYGERLVGPDFGPLAAKLAGEPSLIDRELLDLWTPILETHRPDLVCLTVPFPGNCYAALRLGKAVREVLPAAKIALGGGFASGYLRDLSEPALFDFVDYVVLDDGERPLACLLEHLAGRRPRSGLHRTWVREQDQVAYKVQENLPDIPQAEIGTPTYGELPLDHYFSTMRFPNAITRLWLDLRWNKLSLARGCYWHKCAFCDTHLDYVCRYDPAPIALTLERMERIAAETGCSGFHFIDQAASPKLLKALSQALIERGLSFSWFTNIRFERAFADPALTELMARAGCIGVTGGLETASDRLLTLMDKGITLKQAVRACRALTRAGISVHAYLMYGFPTETEQEMIDSLERVRQLYQLGYIQSANWQRFVLTLHSPMARNPEYYGIRPRLPDGGFARYGIHHDDATACGNLGLFETGLERANNYLIMGIGLERDVRSWFSQPLDPPQVPPDFIRSLVPPDTGEHQDTRRKQPWRPAGADWADRPRHGFRAPDWIVIDPDAQDLVLFDVNEDTAYRFEGIGAECWRLLAAGLSVTEIAERLATSYATPRERVLADISALIDDLCENGLLRRSYAED
ncbi:MAG: PqqD family peptide modification chaperone [Candidatus Thiosymbion ectosymbiont of Robbea hypermnestra]|nr:PqqD family peptide modification chaperone [Candidatus Thiosymbion ectosymbiont of Robbea hypermnestra]